MVEAFSLRGLGLLAASWEKNPPFIGDAPFAKAIRQYRADIIEGYRKPGQPKPGAEFADWFRQNRSALENGGGLTQAEGPAILAILAELERGPAAVEDLGALNRWPRAAPPPRAVSGLVAGELRPDPVARPAAGEAENAVPAWLRDFPSDAFGRRGRTYCAVGFRRLSGVLLTTIV